MIPDTIVVGGSSSTSSTSTSSSTSSTSSSSTRLVLVLVLVVSHIAHVNIRTGWFKDDDRNLFPAATQRRVSR